MYGGDLVAKFTSAGVVCGRSIWCLLDFSERCGVFSGPTNAACVASQLNFHLGHSDCAAMCVNITHARIMYVGMYLRVILYAHIYTTQLPKPDIGLSFYAGCFN